MVFLKKVKIKLKFLSTQRKNPRNIFKENFSKNRGKIRVWYIGGYISVSRVKFASHVHQLA
jgi:hypothetical protein